MKLSFPDFGDGLRLSRAWRPMGLRDLAFVTALLTSSAMTASAAEREALATVRVDRVRVESGGRHRVWVSALDGDGLPITGLGRGAFRVALDDRPVEDLQVEVPASQSAAYETEVVADAPLFAGPERAALATMLERLGADLGAGGRLRVVAAGSRQRALTTTAGAVQSLGPRLAELGTQGEPVRLYDALHQSIRRLGRRSGGAVLVLTRGEDIGSGKGVLQVLAQSRASGRHVPVMLVLLEDQGAGSEGERLRRLAARTGGTSQRIAVAEAASDAAERLLARARGEYRLAFRAQSWDGKAPSHVLEVAVSAEGSRRSAREEYLTAEALGPAWWQGPWVWFLPLALGLTGLLALLGLRRRAAFVLEVENGRERGCWFEVFTLPVTLGAADGNDVTFEDPRVSRNHAMLERRGRAVEIVDLNSENGTFVNDERVTRRVLAEGDTVRLGEDVELLFRHGG